MFFADIVTSIATFGIAGFFVIVVLSNLPWRKLFRNTKETSEEEEDDVNDSDDEVNSEASNSNHAKSEWTNIDLENIYIHHTTIDNRKSKASNCTTGRQIKLDLKSWALSGNSKL